MARVIGLFKLRGSIDDVTFRQTQDGIIAGMKPGPTRERVLSHENFALTRRNAEEFQLAIKDAQLLRHALGEVLDGRTGSSMNGRMNGLFYKAARRDETNDLGFRRAAQGHIDLLTGFNFNKQLSLEYALPVPLVRSLDVGTGACKVEVPSFIARKRKGFPAEATHFRLVSTMVVVDFGRRKYEQAIGRSELLPLRKKTPGTIGFEHKLEVANGQVAVQVLGMDFYKVVDGHEVLVKGSAIRVLEAVQSLESSVQSKGIEAETQGGNEEMLRNETRIEDELHELQELVSEDTTQGVEETDMDQGDNLELEDSEWALRVCYCILSEMPVIFEDNLL
ncbi:MAG: hypothetical protein J7621_08030 [Niastella sp.]|nr:hypothetical protein [Niastella sp.]